MWRTSPGVFVAIAVMLPLSTIAATLAERYGQRIVGTAGLLVAAASFRAAP